MKRNTELKWVNHVCYYSFSTWFYYLPHFSGNARLEVYGASVLLGMGGSTLLIDSLAMISEMIGRNTVGGTVIPIDGLKSKRAV